MGDSGARLSENRAEYKGRKGKVGRGEIGGRRKEKWAKERGAAGGEEGEEEIEIKEIV